MVASGFAWGVVVGVVAGPFVWEGMKWAYGKFTNVTSE
jgi:hypothetical protein